MLRWLGVVGVGVNLWNVLLMCSCVCFWCVCWVEMCVWWRVFVWCVCLEVFVVCVVCGLFKYVRFLNVWKLMSVVMTRCFAYVVGLDTRARREWVWWRLRGNSVFYMVWLCLICLKSVMLCLSGVLWMYGWRWFVEKLLTLIFDRRARSEGRGVDEELLDVCCECVWGSVWDFVLVLFVLWCCVEVCGCCVRGGFWAGWRRAAIDAARALFIVIFWRVRVRWSVKIGIWILMVESVLIISRFWWLCWSWYLWTRLR